MTLDHIINPGIFLTRFRLYIKNNRTLIREIINNTDTGNVSFLLFSNNLSFQINACKEENELTAVKTLVKHYFVVSVSNDTNISELEEHLYSFTECFEVLN